MKKNRIWLTAAIAVLLLSTIACSVSIGNIGLRTVKGSGNVVSEPRQVSGFNAVELSGVGQLIIDIGDVEALTIEAEDNLLEYIETEVRGDTLRISIRERTNINPTEPLNYKLTVTELDSIAVSGAGNVDAPDLVVDRFSVTISGAGGVEIDSLVADRLDVAISGLGNIEIHDGQVTQQEVDISGSGNHEAREMESAEAEIHLSGLGSATVWVTEYLDVGISGAGSVNYAGSPRVDSDVSGLGSLKKIGE